MDRLRSTRDAADVIGLTPQTLRNLVSEGAFTEDETWRESRTRRVFTEKGLQRFIDERKARGKELGPLFKRKSKRRTPPDNGKSS